MPKNKANPAQESSPSAVKAEAAPATQKVEAPPVGQKMEAPPVEQKIEAPPVEQKVEAPPVEQKVKAAPSQQRAAQEQRERQQADGFGRAFEVQEQAYIRGMEAMAERLAAALADRLGVQAGLSRAEIEVVANRMYDAREDALERMGDTIAARLEASQQLPAFRQKALELVRSYAVLREELAGPADADVLTEARIRAILPPYGSVGDEIKILLENAGRPSRVSFAGHDGGTVSTNPESVNGNVVTAKVPDDAVSGPITVTTDRGEPSSTFDFRVLDEVILVGKDYVAVIGEEEW